MLSQGFLIWLTKTHKFLFFFDILSHKIKYQVAQLHFLPLQSDFTPIKPKCCLMSHHDEITPQMVVCVLYKGVNVKDKTGTHPSTPLPLPSLYLQGPCLYLLHRSLHLKQLVSQMNKVSPKTGARMTNRAGHTCDAVLLPALFSACVFLVFSHTPAATQHCDPTTCCTWRRILKEKADLRNKSYFIRHGLFSHDKGLELVGHTFLPQR